MQRAVSAEQVEARSDNWKDSRKKLLSSTPASESADHGRRKRGGALPTPGF